MDNDRNRKRIGRLLGYAAVISVLACQALAADGLSAVLEKVRIKYCNAPGLTMEYRREVTTRSLSMLGSTAKGDLARGRIYYRPPYNLRVEQETPRKEILVTNGKVLWWHIPDERKTDQYPFEQYGQELRVLGDIFRGLVRIEDSFRVKLVSNDPQTGATIELRPDPPWEQIDHILVSVGTESDITAVEIHNVLGTVTRFDLQGIRPQTAFREGFFQFRE
jgi:outer membrane lipoprotein-sorting protein